MRMHLSASWTAVLALSAFVLSSCGEKPPVQPWQDAFGTQVEFGFEDQDPQADEVGGPVVLRGVKSPTEFKAYRVYWAQGPSEADRGEMLGEVDFMNFKSNPLLTLPENSAKMGSHLLLYITDGTAKNTVYTGKSASVRDLVETSQDQPLGQDQMRGPGPLSVEPVYFDFDRSRLKPEDRSMIDQAFEGRDLGGLSLLIVGHADDRGSNAYNLALGQRRAQAVKDYLTRVVGLGADQVTVMSCGEEQPRVEQAERESEHAQNRRAATFKDGGQAYHCAAPPR